MKKKFQSAHEAKINLEALEKQSRYFGVDSRQKTLDSKSKSANQSSHWISMKDLDHTDEINSVGLNNRSYNHEKYGSKPPVHQYSNIGSILQPGMDFNEVEREEIKGPYKKPEVRRNPDWLRREAYFKGKQGQMESQPGVGVDVSGMQLPKNIQHKFGTKLCQSLLSDKEIVDKTIEEQQKMKIKENSRRKNRYGPSHQNPTPNEVSSDPNLNPIYDALGGVLRHNLFPGQTFDHKVGVMKGDFNDSVHKNRVPNPDEYRYKRDDLSKYSFLLNLIVYFSYIQWRIQDFPLGGRRPVGGGHRPLTHTLFGKNVCENERNGSSWGGGVPPWIRH